MPNKYAVIIFICSLAFAATTVFLLCLLQPKSHRISQSDSSKGSTKYGLDAYEALAGLPIKKRHQPEGTRYKIEKRNEPLYDEWAEMGLSVRSIRPISNYKENWQEIFETKNENLPKNILPMSRVLYWQDQLNACEAYKSILCQKAISYWMNMNGLNIANIVKHGRRQVIGGGIDGVKEEIACETPNIKDPNCTRQTILLRNKEGIDQFNDEIQLLNESKAGTELESEDGKINLVEAQDQAQKAGLAPGFIIDTKYPTNPNI